MPACLSARPMPIPPKPAPIMTTRYADCSGMGPPSSSVDQLDQADAVFGPLAGQVALEVNPPCDPAHLPVPPDSSWVRAPDDHRSSVPHMLARPPGEPRCPGCHPGRHLTRHIGRPCGRSAAV